MHHSKTVPSAGFQALILCGPGVSLNTFTSNPEEYPKALIPIANRPMVWYPLDWCYRAGITSITLVTPQASRQPLESALSQNPHLTSLPSPSPSVLTPEDLTFTTGTAELLRLPEVQACIKSDFILLPCDLICDIPAVSLLEAWMTTEGALSGTPVNDRLSSVGQNHVGLGGERAGRRGGVGVWYPLPPKEERIKEEVPSFLAISPLDASETLSVNGDQNVPDPIHFGLANLVYTTPMDTLKDILATKKVLHLRGSLLQRHGRVKLLSTHRDAHVYVFPYWVKEMAQKNEKFESVSEDLVGWWAKAGWQRGLGDKLGLRDIFDASKTEGSTVDNDSQSSEVIEDEIDLAVMSTTQCSKWSNTLPQMPATHNRNTSRMVSQTSIRQSSVEDQPSEKLHTPPILAYVLPSGHFSERVVRRVDSSALLLAVSLRLAKFDSIADIGREAASPFAHQQKVAYPEGIAQRCTITKTDCLLADNVTVEEKCTIKESVVGANCHVSTLSRLTRCLLMDGAVVEQGCNLTDCIVGRRSKIGRKSILKHCEVQDGTVVPDSTDAVNEKFMVFEGLDEDLDDMDELGNTDHHRELGSA